MCLRQLYGIFRKFDALIIDWQSNGSEGTPEIGSRMLNSIIWTVYTLMNSPLYYYILKRVIKLWQILEGV